MDGPGSRIAELVGTRGWLGGEAPPEFVETVLEDLRAQNAEDAPEAAVLERSVKRCYARWLYAGTGAEKLEERGRAYQELERYLFASARYLLRDAEEMRDATQRALTRVMEERGNCRDEASFLGWCQQVLVNDVRDMRRRAVKKETLAEGERYVKREILMGDLAPEREDVYDAPPLPGLREDGDPVAEEALRNPMFEALLYALRKCLEKERRVRVIVELFLNGKALLQVAQELGLSARNAQVIKQRALETLRECDDMKRLNADWTA